MLIASYNRKQMGNILVVILHQDTGHQQVEIKQQVVRIFDSKRNLTLGYNFLDADQLLPDLKDQNGQVHLTSSDLSSLNQQIKQAGFSKRLAPDPKPRFVVGLVKSVKSHPNSDRLKITKTEVDHHQTLQIVSGSPNMRTGIRVVVAKVGAMMPNGMIIWPSQLKGVASNGMICAGYELHLPNAPQHPGALVLPDSYQVGDRFDFKRAANLFK